MTRIFLPALMLLLLVSGAKAATLDGVTFPDSYPVDGQSLVLNGMGLRSATFLRIRVYVAALYLLRPNHDADQILTSPGPKVVLMQFLRSGSKAQVEKQYREGEQNNCGDGGCARSDEADFERMVAAAPAVKPGDTLTYLFVGKGFKILFNNQQIGDYANPDLAYHMLAGFIGKHPPTPALRSRLLGMSDE